MNQHYKVCQSCGMPLKKDTQGGGTHQDGTKSMVYCSHCFQQGKFTRNCTAKEMQNVVVDALHTKMKLPIFLAKFLVRNIPKLERWQKK